MSTTILKAKDLADIMDCSERTAKKYLRDIKEHFDIKVVMQYHFDRYFKLE